ncbi:hypothetical protein SRHO_G00149790 [Serrasalmus rhombeus]
MLLVELEEVARKRRNETENVTYQKLFTYGSWYLPGTSSQCPQEPNAPSPQAPLTSPPQTPPAPSSQVAPMPSSEAVATPPPQMSPIPPP